MPLRLKTYVLEDVPFIDPVYAPPVDEPYRTADFPQNVHAICSICKAHDVSDSIRDLIRRNGLHAHRTESENAPSAENAPALFDLSNRLAQR